MQYRNIENDFRCTKCNRKLAVGVAIKLSIKCPRCGQMFEYENAPRERGVCEQSAHNPEH